MVKLIEKTVSLLKRDSSYRLDTTYSVKQLLSIMLHRFAQALRGVYLKLWIKSKGIVFCGKGVNVEHGYQLSAGKSLILENYVHINALSENGIKMGNNVTIAKQAIITCTGVIANKGMGIVIGNNSAVGAQSFLGGQGGIAIGDDVIMGPQVKIFSENHNYKSLEMPIRKQGESRKGVTIGNNCWIGSGATILDGVIIGNGCVVAANAVVTKSFPENSIIAGIPAKIISKRGEN